jgi:peptidoglycan/xylan/chitin deacetylase (PgdA/CDA1 family)
VNPALKKLAERTLVSSGVASVAGKRLRKRALVLAYHNIVPTGELVSGDASLHLPLREFARQLDALAKTHEVLSLDKLFDPQISSHRPGVVITFDDAYAGALSAGLDELVKRGMPATVFVAPGLLGSAPWWDQLADPEKGEVAKDLRARALGPLGGKSESILRERDLQSLNRSSSLTLLRIATESQLAAAARKPGVTFGSHSWSHPNLSALGPAELERELTLPLQWLRERSNISIPWLSYPYGLFTDLVQRAARKAGYVGAFRIEGGWFRRSSPPPAFAVPRLNIPSGLSIDGFRLRLAGL